MKCLNNIGGNMSSCDIFHEIITQRSPATSGGLGHGAFLVV